MQFIATSDEEYTSTILAILESNIYDEVPLIYAVNISTDGEVLTLPEKYPVTVSIEIEEISTDNRRYAFSACKFIYHEELLSATRYKEKLQELKVLDGQAMFCLDQINTSGTLEKPILEFEALNKRIEQLEKELF